MKELKKRYKEQAENDAICNRRIDENKICVGEKFNLLVVVAVIVFAIASCVIGYGVMTDCPDTEGYVNCAVVNS